MDESAQEEALNTFIEATETLARRLLGAEEVPYEVARELHSTAMGAVGNSVGDVAHAVWLIWGYLTDLVDSPGSAPADARASLHMSRAAAQWLDVSRSTEARKEYLQRWVYEECGYERP